LVVCCRNRILSAMSKIFLLCLFVFSSIQECSASKILCKESVQELESSGPAVLPEAPPAPKRAPIEPPPAEPRPQPRRREIPIPIPDEPARKIPAKPLEDPKDIQPEDLYESDSQVQHFWREIPIGLRRLMIEEMRKEKSKLEAHMIEKYGSADPLRLMRAVLTLQSEIEGIESHHKKEILDVIGTIMTNRYGPEIQNLTIRISRELPQPSQPKSDGRQIPELPKSLDAGMIYRTELRNLWLQGEGWVGMKEFAYLYAPQLNAIHSGLAEKYQELDRLYRIGQLVQLDLIDVAGTLDEKPKEAMSAGRQIVSSDFEIIQGETGSPAAVVKETKGIAVGRNGWAAAHEARKAASHMVTPSEGAYRWMLTTDRREKLNEATNSARAEIRQGVFGPAVVQALKKRIDLISPQPLDDQKYYRVMDGYFSLPPNVFINVTKIIFDSSFETNSGLQKEARHLLQEYRVLE
jgi:hypothetical protein